jgi:PLP dependent protein
VMGVAALDQELDRDFSAIRAASEALKTLRPEADQISAGMSEDFETAIGYGATHLRIGSAITGKRQY